jgi:RNA polymerase sigma-70 factor (ECF subfamily)
MVALLERARHQDAAAFQTLFRAHLESVHRLVHRIVGPLPEVEDLVQTVFIEAFRSLADFRGDALFSTWLARIALRVTLRAIKRRPPRAISWEAKLEVGAEPGLEPPSAERRVAARESLALLDRLLAELRPKPRAAFVLHVLEGYPVEEVAAILNASPAAVKVRVHDARRYIERRLQRDPRLGDLLEGTR